MLRQKRYFVANLALILLISGCGLKGPLYQTPDKPAIEAENTTQQPKIVDEQQE